MLDWALVFKVTIALFAIVNPIGILPIFISATDGWSKQERQKTAKTVGFTVFLVLVGATFLGDKILHFFSISIPSFQVGGGILLMLIAIAMMHGRQSGTKQTPEEAETLVDHKVIAIVPLSIPMLAGPGAISQMIITAQQNPTIVGHLSLVLPIFVMSLLIWLTFALHEPIAKQLGSIGINVITRLMGLVLAAMAVEFVAHGLIGLFPTVLGPALLS